MRKEKKISVQFLGAAGTVTGSKYLLNIGDYRVLVDSGLFQGVRELRRRNWDVFPFPASRIDAVLITHGHLDHVGYLPRLVKQGLKCPVYCTNPTADLMKILLKDTAKIQEEDAVHANENKYSKYETALPLYDLKDVEKTLPLLHPVAPDEYFSLNNNIKIMFRKNAHILGATFIEMELFGKRIVFSGDIGRPDDAMLEPREIPNKADILFIESTYGDRLHPKKSTENIIRKIINNAVANHGPLIVSSFTIDRAQDFMYVIWKLKQAGEIPDIPVYLDSPMGTDVSHLFIKYSNWLKFNNHLFTDVFRDTRLVTSIQETFHLAKDKNLKIIIAGSGMLNGGRVLHYLEKQLGNPNATVVLPGYQAVGTRGRQLSEGVSEIKLHGKYYEVRATVEHITTMSSHADQKEIISWLSEIKNSPKQIFIVHGEPQSSDSLRVKIRDVFGWECTIPHYKQDIVVDL